VIRRYQIDPKNMKQVIERAKSGFVPLVSHLSGFASYSILDAGHGTLATMRGFTTRSGSDESIKAAATFIKENLSSLVPKPPEVTSGEVKVMVRSH
jgi:imidazolonepropionase-like amidohydrolase